MQGRVLAGRYRLLWQLGQGGMGSVWQAEQLNLPIKLAIKLIDPNQAGSTEIRERFRREAHAAAKLRSRHIVHISDYGIDEDTPYIVMELLEGESLAKRLARQGKLSCEEALRVLSQVTRAVALAHENGIVHRDLKPENVFIEGYLARKEDDPTETELVKVLDFGVAKMLDTQSFGDKLKTHTGMLLGTPYYMSPEQIRNCSDVDHRADIWSFGVMAYECVTGRRPFEANNLADLHFSVCRDPVVPPSQVATVPCGFDDWFAQAAARDLTKRFGTIKAAMARLRAVLGDEARVSPAVAAPAQDTKPVLPVVTEIVVAPAVSPAPEVRSIEPAVPEIASPSAVSQSSFGPSSATSPGLLKRATRPRLAAALLAVLGAVGTAWYFARSPSSADPSNAAAPLKAFAATPDVSAEVAADADRAPNTAPEATAAPAASAGPVVAPAASGNVQVAPVDTAAKPPVSKPPRLSPDKPARQPPAPRKPAPKKPNRYGFD